MLDDYTHGLPTRGFVKRHQSKVKIAGWLMVALGIAAVFYPIFFTIATKFVVGWFLIVVGAITLYHAFNARTWDIAALSTFVAVFYLAGGVYLAMTPYSGFLGVTAILALAFVAQAGIEWILSRKRRPRYGWRVVRMSAVISAILGVALFWIIPVNADWVIGSILGVNVVTTGMSFLAVVYLPNH